jgi:hypothetical protein
MRRISSFSSQGAVFPLSDFNEFEQTSSANLSVWCAGVDLMGRISYNSTSMPRRAHCHAASQPASPAPMILIGVLTSLLKTAYRGFAVSNQQSAFSISKIFHRQTAICA